MGYDPALGRFTQPDSIIPQPGNPLDWDRYSYVRNSPINYTDPTGHMLTDGCSYEGCDSKHPDWIMHTLLVASYPIALPYSTTSYAENAEESSCAGCSMEPYVKPENSQIAGLGSAPGLANDAASGIGDFIVNHFLPPVTFVSLNYYEDANGDLYIDNLQINNGSGGSISLVSLSFQTTGSPNCFDCVYGTGGDYAISPGPSIMSYGSVNGIGSAQPNSITNISLVPSNYEHNPHNHFYPYEQVSILGYLAYTDFEKYFPAFHISNLPRASK